MAQGRGSAVAVGFLALCLLLAADIAGATTHNVDWSFNADSWSKSRAFRAGDVLVFNYDSSAHNVVVVDAGGYNNCRGSGRTYSSGRDQVTLGAGTTFFICTVSGHCGGGMKMAVTAN